MAKKRMTFETPGLLDRRRPRPEESDYVRREWHGPTYQIRTSDQRHQGEPRYPHGVPQDLRPSLIQILAGAPRALGVSQQIEHGPEESRSAAFDEASQQELQPFIDLGRMHHSVGLGPIGLEPYVFQERRVEGRRHRATFDGDDYPQKAPPRGGWQRDVDPSRYLSF